MSLNPTAVGTRSAPVRKRWTSRDAQLYALGVGAGCADLRFTTDNTKGITQAVLPTMAVVLAVPPRDTWSSLGDVNWARMLHGAQGIEVLRPIPTAGEVESVTEITGIFDKGSGAVVDTSTTSVDVESGDVLFTARSSLFIRGEGGWGGDRGPSVDRTPMPDSAPDHVVRYVTSPDQALVYRLSGDRNPLHSDPVLAASAGFDRPILHGLCTYGFTGRALLGALCGDDVARFRSMDARFSAPVYPGDELTVSVWETVPGAASFQVHRDGPELVLDGGSFTWTPG